MSHHRATRYDNLSPEALAKLGARVGNRRRVNQIARAMARHGMAR